LDHRWEAQRAWHWLTHESTDLELWIALSSRRISAAKFRRLQIGAVRRLKGLVAAITRAEAA
jgi:hypothetical protein